MVWENFFRDSLCTWSFLFHFAFSELSFVALILDFIQSLLFTILNRCQPSPCSYSNTSFSFKRGRDILLIYFWSFVEFLWIFANFCLLPWHYLSYVFSLYGMIFQMVFPSGSCNQVGVDNMCILVHAVKRQPLDLPLEIRISNALAEVGPSITLASLSEILAFAVGSFIPMPACRVFSMFAGKVILLLS